MRTSVLAVLSIPDHERLIEYEAAVRALPYEYNGSDLYNTAVRAQKNLLTFKANMTEKYLMDERTLSQAEDLYGDYGFDFDPIAGTITKDES